MSITKRMTKIRALRQARGLSIVEFSHEARVNPSVISVVERRRGVASRKVQEAVAAFFGIPKGELFDDEGWAMIYDPEPIEAV